MDYKNKFFENKSKNALTPRAVRPVSVLRIRIRMFFSLMDAEPLVIGTDPDPSIIKQKMYDKP